jgi:hypothetical protein
MEKMRILVANEPCIYREAITNVLRELRPHIEVSAIEPESLDREVTSHCPHLVVCSRITAAMHNLSAWIMLYPESENHAVISTGGERTTVNNIRFSDLLSTIDQTELLLSEVSS